MHKQKGMALIIVLIFLNILVLFSMYAMQNNQWQYKMAASYWQRHKILAEADQVLRQVEAGMQIRIPNCIIPLTAVAELSSAPLSWWQSSVSCVGNSSLFQYYYVIESMQGESCFGVNPNQAVEMGRYFRLSLLAISTSGKQAKILLQSTLVVPGTTENLCHKIAKLGRQSWREIKS